jgi:hypothetical protein
MEERLAFASLAVPKLWLDQVIQVAFRLYGRLMTLHLGHKCSRIRTRISSQTDTDTQKSIHDIKTSNSEQKVFWNGTDVRKWNPQFLGFNIPFHTEHNRPVCWQSRCAPSAADVLVSAQQIQRRRYLDVALNETSHVIYNTGHRQISVLRFATRESGVQ